MTTNATNPTKTNKRYRVSVMEIETVNEAGALRNRYTPAGRFETLEMTPWDAVVRWADEIKAQEAS